MKKFLLITAALLILAAIQTINIARSAGLTVLNIGQGDAILIKTPEYKNILIDAGPDSKIVSALGKHLGFFHKKIDLFILTHPHSDHVGGALDIMKNYKIDKILITGVFSNEPLYGAFINNIRDKNIETIYASADNDIQISSDLYLDIIYPSDKKNLIGAKAENLNNTSIIIRLTQIKDNKQMPIALLTGDAEQEEEYEILLTGQDISAPILKLGHHGSRTATSKIFLSAVNPKTAVISAGKDNRFSHPHPETLEKIKDLDIRQTKNGDVVFQF